MGNYKNKTNNLPAKTKTPKNWKNIGALMILLFLLAIIIIIGATYYIYKNYTTTDNDSTANISSFHSSDGLPRKIYAYSGKLIEKNNDSLKIALKKDDNYILSNKEITVIIDKNTKFRKFIAPKSIPELKPGDTGSYYERVDITLKDIKLNDLITVIANENVKNKTKFTAAIIEAHNK